MRCNHSQFLLISSLTFSVSMNSLIAPSVIAWFVRVKAFNAHTDEDRLRGAK